METDLETVMITLAESTTGKDILVEMVTESLLNTAKITLVEDGKVQPVALMVAPIGVMLTDLSDFMNPERKPLINPFLRVSVRESGAKAVFMVFESWQVEMEKDDPFPGLSPAEHPLHTEAILVDYALADGTSGIRTIAFQRREDGTVLFGEDRVWHQIQSKHLKQLFADVDA